MLLFMTFFFFCKNYRDERKLMRELEREPIDDDIIYIGLRPRIGL